jgi:hypothetical protein
MEWLLLAQHCGLPTRLLDWSNSPLVALYFAVWNSARDGEDGAVWFLHATDLNRRVNGQPVLLHVSAAEVVKSAAEAFSGTAINAPAVIALFPHEIDVRMQMQQSAFTLHSRPQALHEMPDWTECLRMFTVPAHAKANLRHVLEVAGIFRATLFPDLANLAKWVEETDFGRSTELPMPPETRA